MSKSGCVNVLQMLGYSASLSDRNTIRIDQDGKTFYICLDEAESLLRRSDHPVRLMDHYCCWSDSGVKADWFEF